MLRAVIFGLEGVLIKDAAGAPGTGLVSASAAQIRTELRALFDFLRAKNVSPILLSNRSWEFVDMQNGTKTPMDPFLARIFGPHKLYVTSRGDLPNPKPTKACVTALLEREGLRAHEVIMVGVSEMDFRTAVNSKLLFINATWDRHEQDYGFEMDSPAEVMRFVDQFALREHPWFYAIDDPVVYRSPAPFSTRLQEFALYSDAARQAAKTGTPERHFFLNTLIGSLYFSDLTRSLNYIACVPGHEAGSGNPAMDDVLRVLGQVLGARYLQDLIVRHSSAPSQREERIAGRAPDPETQLRTLRLNKHPKKPDGTTYLNPVSLRDKHVLVFDDSCTRGYSLEASRLLLQAAGARVTLVSWLKTINSSYTVLSTNKKLNPWAPVAVAPGELQQRPLPYSQYIIDRMAPAELHRRFLAYKGWAPPA